MVHHIFEINHPAHVHLFRNVSQGLLEKSISSLFLIKSDQVIKKLVNYYDLPSLDMGLKGKGLVQKYLFQLRFLWKTKVLVNRIKASLGIGVSLNLPLVSSFIKMASIGLDDDDMEITPTFAKYANKANVILTPDVLSHEKRGQYHISYPGYHELAYLHPNRFNPDESVLEILDVKPSESYFILRFNAFTAHHDIGEKGMTFEQKKHLIEMLSERGKVFISSEKEVDESFRHLLLPDKPELMHSILGIATMYVGESQTMTSEAAVLGTPAFKCNSFKGRLSVSNELEKKYMLCYSFHPESFNNLLEKMDEILKMPNSKIEWLKRKEKFHNDKINVTAFFAWFIENYPLSVNVINSNPEYSQKFK